LNLDYNDSSLLFSINGVTFFPPTVPVLLQILSRARTAQDLLPHGSVFTLPLNKVVEVTIPGGINGGPVRDERLNLLYILTIIQTIHRQHPFHLHGVRIHVTF
jgi:hypothetical protein